MRGRRLRVQGAQTGPVRSHQGGFVAEGPGFYIWDESLDEVLRVARELSRSNFRLRPSQRLLLMDAALEEAQPA